MSDGPRPASYVVPAPSEEQIVVWPAGFGTRFTVFVDVEEEFDWSAPLSRAHRSTSAMTAFPAAHRWFAERGVGLNCMVDYPIATDDRSIDILRRVIEDGRSEIGTQLHSWVNPPFDEPDDPVFSHAGNLPRRLEAAKLDVLTAAIAEAFGRRPRLYRAGRYGIGPNTMALLEERGYRLDSSVRPHYRYPRDHGPDFSAVDARAYRSGGIVEIPLTTIFIGRLRWHGRALYDLMANVPRGAGALSRLGLLSRVALTPEDMPIADALEAVTIAVGEGLALLNFSFHSPTLAPGNTPYVRDAADLRTFYLWWERMLARLGALNVEAITIDDVIRHLDG